MNSLPLSDSTRLDASALAAYRHQIERLPLTMRPALNQQLSNWENLFPFEQNRFKSFLRGVASFSPAQFDELTQPLRALEAKMDVAHWNFSVAADTMENASQLARSPYYAEWRQEVQRAFSAIGAAARQSAPPHSAEGRLVFLILPETLPIKSISAGRPWDVRGVEFPIEGDPRRLAELAVAADSGLPALLAQQTGAEPGVASADCWLIDADAKLGALLAAANSAPASVLDYATLKPFRDELLSRVNTVPKDIEATDRILDQVRHRNWDAFWPVGLAGQSRLRSFTIETFLSGNGALIFSNAFVQWAASEALRRARPRLIVGRFGMRSKPKPFTSIAIFENQQKISALRDVDDPEGSAIDALILARYVWLSALRYPEQQHTCCVCVAEANRTAYLIAPQARRPEWAPGSPVSPDQLYAWMRRQLLA